MTQWELVGRESSVATVVGHVGAGRSVLVRGQRGAGRSAVLAAVADRVVAPLRVLSISGREREGSTPFLPWAAVLGAYEARLDEPLTIYTQVPRRIADDVDLLLVDDLDLLDAGSALLTVQLARLGVQVVATTTTGAEVPESLRDAVTRWRSEELAPLTDAEIETIGATVAGAALTAPTASRLVAWSRGLPAAAVSLVAASRDAGRLSQTPAGVHVVEPAVPDRLLALAGVEPEVGRPHRELLDVLATAGQLPVTAFPRAGLAELIRGGWVDVVGETATLAHPLLVAWCLHRLGPAQRRHLYRSAAALHEGSDASGRLIAHLRACAGQGADPLALVEAAAWLLDRHRHAEAGDLLASVHTDDTTVAWHWCLTRARVHRELGERREALVALDEAVPHARTDEQLVELVQRWAAVLGGWVEDDDALEERVATLAHGAHDHAVRAGLTSILQRRRAILGDRRARPVLQVVTDPIVGLLQEAMGGSPDVARAYFVPPPDQEVHDDEDLDEVLQVLGRFLGLVYNGDLVEGRAEAEHFHAQALREARPSLGLWSYNRTKIAFHAGQYQLAVARGREMRRHLAWRDVAGQGLPGEALLAAALARSGHGTQALELLDALGAEERKLPRVRLGVHRVLAEQEIASRRITHAAALLYEAGQYAMELGEGHSGLLALDEAFALDPSEEHGDVLLAQAAMSGIAAAAADRVRAVRAGDPRLLEEVGTRFAAMPLFGRAAQCWESAARLHDSAGRSEAARRLRSRAALLCAENDVTPWPATDHGPLTLRELEVARLAADRVRTKEIAERLGLSPRTVDNHLTRIYRKLDVSGRDELARALDG